MLNNLLEGILIGVLLLAFFEIIERVRIATGKEMFTDKMLVYLEGIHRRTKPMENDEPDVLDYYLSDKVTVRKVSFSKNAKDEAHSEKI